MRLREHVGAVRTQQRPGREAQTKQPGPSSQTRAAEARAAATMPPKGDDADFVPKKKEGECVKVVVRVRPLSRKEIQDGHDEATKADEDSGRISASRGFAAVSRHRRDSPPSDEAVGSFLRDFELVRTASGPSRRVRETAVAQVASRAKIPKRMRTSRRRPLRSTPCLRRR